LHGGWRALAASKHTATHEIVIILVQRTLPGNNAAAAAVASAAAWGAPAVGGCCGCG
jgi:hypothetical protein